jgi:DNA-binding NarL/FixJ family response regulator
MNNLRILIADDPDASTELLIAVEALANNQTFFTSGAAQVLLDEISRPPSDGPQTPLMHKSLTSRQREVLQLLAEGNSSKEVAVALNISVKTAETHRVAILRRLEVHSVSQLVRYAVKNHIIEP